jgi:RNA polymerase sigma-70 factor (ECF subfamily)
VVDKSVDFARQALTKERLRKGMHKLTEEQRQVIILKFIEGYSNSEVAEYMGKSVGAVKVLQFRALRALRGYFKKRGYESKD